MVTFSPNGMATKTRNAGIIAISGASLKRNLSALSGTMSSFKISFRVSARGCSMPCGPTLMGPSLTWICPATFLSSQVRGIGRLKMIPVRIQALTIIISTSIRVPVSSICYSAGRFKLPSFSAPHVIYHLDVPRVHAAHYRMDREYYVTEELVYYPRVCVYEGLEVVLVYYVGVEVGYRHYGRRPGPAVEEAHLAEDVAVLHYGEREELAVRGGLAGLYLALPYDEKRLAVLGFLEYRLPGLETLLVHYRGDSGNLSVSKVCKKLDFPQQFRVNHLPASLRGHHVPDFRPKTTSLSRPFAGPRPF